MWTTAFALPHMTRALEDARQQSRSARAQRCRFRERGARVQQHHDIMSANENRPEKITSERRREFGFFSGLRARMEVRIMLARFDPRF
jgi:hypothetical protein